MKELYELGIVRHAEPFFPRTRDRADIAVLKDEAGVIFLNSTDHMDLAHYQGLSIAETWGAKERTEALAATRDDDTRRAAYVSALRPKRYIDVGCGLGGTMELLVGEIPEIHGVEPQADILALLKSRFTMYTSIGDVSGQFDVASLFHVFEHLTEPMAMLKKVHERLVPGGRVIIEVPHARDALLALDAFKAFSFWSEHLVLHTRQSLAIYLEKAGFHTIEIKGVQRYPLANHLRWLVEGLPGGQKTLSQYADPTLAAAYEAYLVAHDSTDTLLAIAQK